MSTAVLSGGIKETSPKQKARLAGAFYLLTILAGVFAQAFISERLVASGDAAATAKNILANESLFRLGFAVYLIEMSCQLVMTALFYELFKPVSKSVSLLSAIFGYVGAGIKILSRLFFFTPLLVLGGAPYLSVFNPQQLEALSLLFLLINDQAAAIALVFFGFHTLLRGYLILKSTFLPRFLGVLSVLGGLGWLTFLSRSLGDRMFPYVVGVGLLGSVATIFWLLVYGVNEQRWNEQAKAASASLWR